MYARSTTVQGDAAGIDDAVNYVRSDVMPMIEGIEGFVGMSLLGDRTTGRCIATSAWESREAMRASDARVREARDRLGDLLQGGMDIQEWEIATLHRAQPAPDGACARVVWLRIEDIGSERVMQNYRELLSELEQMEGFCSASLLVDRESGRAASTTVWASRETMNRHRDQLDRMRAERTQRIGAQVEDTAEFDVLLARLRVPETV